MKPFQYWTDIMASPEQLEGFPSLAGALGEESIVTHTGLCLQ